MCGRRHCGKPHYEPWRKEIDLDGVPYDSDEDYRTGFAQAEVERLNKENQPNVPKSVPNFKKTRARG